MSQPTQPNETPSPDAETRPVCATCGGDAIRGGPIVPDEAMVRRMWLGWCAFGEGWQWCQREGGTFKRSH